MAKHVSYIHSLDSDRDTLAYHQTAHLRLSGLYWALTALCLLRCPPKDVFLADLPGQRSFASEPTDSSIEAVPASPTMNRADIIKFTLSCQKPCGGFGSAPGHDAHLLYTVSAIQILAIVDALDALDSSNAPCRGGRNSVGQWIANLQDKKTGCFAGDEWGEFDTRFLYGAFNALSLLGYMEMIDVPLAVSYVQACGNFDGAYGVSPGAESHAGQVFTCVGALSIAGRLDLIDRDQLGGWLSERQLPSGGLNGRPEKLEDVCYSWWVVSSLAIIDRLDWIDTEKLQTFILAAQDPDLGGIADRPGDVVDVFHTYFGIAGLSLTGYDGLLEVDPV